MSAKNHERMVSDMRLELIAEVNRLKDPRLECGLLTITRLDVTPDLDVAKVYVSILNAPNGEREVTDALNRASGHIRTEISKKMHIRKAPKFVFVADEGAQYAMHINELLNEIHAGE